jgi:hypothetical protein
MHNKYSRLTEIHCQQLATEWASLFHRNEAILDLEVCVPSVDLRASGHLIRKGTRVFAKSLLLVGHRSRCRWHNGSWVDIRTYTLGRAEMSSSSPHE